MPAQEYVPISRYSSKSASRPGSWSWKSSSQRVYFLSRFLVLERCIRLLHQLYIFLQVWCNALERQFLVLSRLASKTRALQCDAHTLPFRDYEICAWPNVLSQVMSCAWGNVTSWVMIQIFVNQVWKHPLWKLGYSEKHSMSCHLWAPFCIKCYDFIWFTASNSVKILCYM